MRRSPSKIAVLLCALACGGLALAADPNKVLRIATPDIETLDPQQITDSPSSDIADAIFEGLYEWDYLAATAKLAPLVAAALPEITGDGKLWTIRIRPGIQFTSDPAFADKSRELTADDVVYSLKRWLDPSLRRGGSQVMTDLLVGAREIIDAAKATGGKFDYEREMPGLRALDRHTLQLRLNAPNYANVEPFLTVRIGSRTVIGAAGRDLRTRAIGTGAFKLKEWKVGSRIVLEANPEYRQVRFPESDDPARAPLIRQMQGKVLPQIGRIEISVIEEDVTRLLEFEAGKLDYVVLRGEIANRLLAGGQVKPEYAKRGITRQVFIEPFLFTLYLNMEDPVLGGMGKQRVALRRAMALAFDAHSLARVVYAGQAVAANQLVPPGVTGHDPALRPRPPADPVAANALLDRTGYDKRDPDGYRRAPDGGPLTLAVSLRAAAISREIQTQWQHDMDAIGLRMTYRLVPFQDLIKDFLAGKYQIYFGGYGGTPSGFAELSQLDSRQPSNPNISRFKLPEYDRLLDEFVKSPGSAAQIAAARRMTEIALTYAPEIPTIFRLESDYLQPWLQGFSSQKFQTYWKYLDIDLARRGQKLGR